MRVATKLALYGGVLVCAFGTGAAVGAAFGPDPDEEPASVPTEPAADHETHAD